MRPNARLLVVLSGLAVLLPARSVRGQALNAAPVEPGKLRVDGHLGDWRGTRFARVGQAEDGSFRYAFAYTERGLYIGARVRDDRFIRRSPPGLREDALVLTLAVPRGAGWRGTDVWLYAGRIGRQAASAATAPVGGSPRPARAVTIVEGPLARGKGYVLEAFVPWKAVGAARVWSRARAALRMHDVDDPTREKAGGPATRRVDAAKLGRLPRLKPSQSRAHLAAFAKAAGLAGAHPRFDLSGDVAEDRQKERVVLIDVYVVVLGDGFRGGERFAYAKLPVTQGTDVRWAKLRDVTGDGKKEMLLQLKQRGSYGKRELLQVFGFGGARPEPLFTAEVRVATEEGSVEAQLDVRAGKSGQPPSLVFSAGEARGVSASSFAPREASGLETILVPWGEVVERHYRWDGAGFAVIHEERNERPRRTRATSAARQNPPERRPRPAPRPEIEDVVAEFKRQRGLPARQRGRFRRRVNVTGDRRPETLILFGKELLVAGAGFGDGHGFVFFGLPVTDPSHVDRLFTGDVTGDGRNEIFVCIWQHLGDVRRRVLYAYQVGAGGFERILAVEHARKQGNNAVVNRVRLRQRGRGSVLRLAPGDARGWTQASYPFLAESQDGIDPLLLPWRDRPVRYRFDGGRLVRRR